MRTAIAAVFAGLMVVGLAIFAWRAVEDRASVTDDQPDEVIDLLLDALARGPDADIAAVVRTGADELAAAMRMVDTALDQPVWRTERGPVLEDAGRATTDATISLDSDTFGTVTWDTQVEATRVRGQWGLDVTTATLHPELREGHRVVIEHQDVTRSSILAHDGEPLTAHGTSWVIGIAPGQVVNEDRLLQVWETALPHSLGDLQHLLDRTDTNPTWFYPVVTVSESRYESAWTRLRAVPGVIARDAQDATPTDGDLAAHVLGRVGHPTAEQMTALGVGADAIVGLHGLERVLESRLVGSEVSRIVIVRADDAEVAELARRQDDVSEPVTTTLDRLVQEAVENALVGISSPVGVVVVDTDTSAIRAAASRPLSGYNRAFEGNYPPGDAFLPVIAEALLASGVALDDDASCPAEDTVAGARLVARTALGDTTVGDALAAGCDTTVGRLAAGLDATDLTDAAGRFGWGTDPGLPLPAATASLPTPVDSTELVRAAVGQARVQASVLHMATVVAASTTGTWQQPFLLAEAADDRTSAPLSDGASDALTRLLALGAEGSGAALGAAGGQGVAGTAAVTGSSTVHAWAIGLVDDLAFAVLTEDTGGSLDLALQVAERFILEVRALRG